MKFRDWHEKMRSRKAELNTSEKIEYHSKLKKIFMGLWGVSLLIGWSFLIPAFVVGGNWILSACACASFTASLGFNIASSVNNKKENMFKSLLENQQVFDIDENTDFVQHDYKASLDTTAENDKHEIPTIEVEYSEKSTKKIDPKNSDTPNDSLVSTDTDVSSL